MRPRRRTWPGSGTNSGSTPRPGHLRQVGGDQGEARRAPPAGAGDPERPGAGARLTLRRGATGRLEVPGVRLTLRRRAGARSPPPLRPPGATREEEEAVEHVPRAGGDDVPIHEDVELATFGSLGDFHLEPGPLPDDGGETRRLRSVASEIAVENPDLHGRSFPPLASPSSAPDRRSARLTGDPRPGPAARGEIV